ncbi:MAG TPA: MDR family MFS transporter, partial [Devosia sp.]|nr:MDR family MFS transporter [Devosia sp.]
IMVTALPTIAHDLGDVQLLGWVGASYLLSTAAVSPFYGKLGDMYGRKPVVLFAVAAFLLGSLLCGLAWSMPTLIAARVLQGIGGGGLMVSAMAIIGELFEPRERAKYQGYSTIVFTLGSVLGPVAGGYLTDLFGWRSVFLVNLPIGVVVLCAIALFLRRRTGGATHRVDFLGGGLLAIGTVAIVYWSNRVLEAPHFDLPTVSLPLLGLVAIAAFVWTERRAAEPIVPLALFRNRTISLVVVASLLAGASTLGLYFYFALYLQMVTQLPPGEIGLMFLPMSIAVAVTSIAAGRLIAATGRYKALPIAGSALGVGLMIFYALSDSHTPLWALGVSFLVFGISMGLTMQTMLVAIQASAPLKDIGAATGLATQARTIGASLGLALNGAVMSAGLSSAGGALPEAVGRALPGGLASLTPKAAETLPPDLREVALQAFAHGFAPTFLFVGALYLATVLLLAALSNAPIPKHAMT